MPLAVIFMGDLLMRRIVSQAARPSQSPGGGGTRMTSCAGRCGRTRGVSGLCGALLLIVAAAGTARAELTSGLLTTIKGEVIVERAGQASTRPPALAHAV